MARKPITPSDLFDPRFYASTPCGGDEGICEAHWCTSLPDGTAECHGCGGIREGAISVHDQSAITLGGRHEQDDHYGR